MADSIVTSLFEHALAQPGANALLGPRRTLTYGMLMRGTEAAAAWLREEGVKAGDVVALHLEQNGEGVWRGPYLFYGLAFSGAVVLPLTPDVPRADHAPLMERFGARWIVSTRADANPGGAVRRLDPARFDEARAPRRAPVRADEAGQPFIYQFSSGTTGVPKALLFTHGQFVGYTHAGVEADGWVASDRAVTSAPWPTKVGLRYLCRLHAAGGALAVSAFPMSAEQLAYLERNGITGVCGSSAQARNFLVDGLPTGTTLPGLRMLRVSGSASRPEELRALRERITPNLYYGYGTTETATIGMLGPEDPIEDTLAMKIAVSGLEARAVDDDGRPVARGEEGQLCYRASWIPREYAGNPEASARTFRDGWFYPGDLGLIDAAGRIVLRGRSDDVVNYCGTLIMPQAVEATLEQHPGVKEAVLIGVPDTNVGQLPVAVVVPRGKIGADALMKHCTDRLGAIRSPRHIVFTHELPRNSAGKVQRKLILERLLAERSAKAGNKSGSEPD